MKFCRAMIFILLAMFSLSGFAASTYLTGKIKNLTAVKGGILLMLDAGVPDNCAGTPYGWMMASENDKAISSVALTLWTTKRLTATIYTSNFSGAGFCQINQIDPAEN